MPAEEKNKLVIIGNGFDLGHGLKTSYINFLDWLIEKICVSTVPHPFFQTEFSHVPNARGLIINGDKRPYVSTSELFKELLTHYNSEARWVDIEAVYFSILTRYFKSIQIPSMPETEFKIKIKKLNSDLDIIKNELEEYLTTINVLPRANSTFEYFFSDVFDNTIISDDNFKNQQAKTLILNFNYTNTLNTYKHLINRYCNEIIDIHGKLNHSTNKIIFGYGDEMNPHHKDIVDMNMNDLFTHFKSFKYALTDNYSKLLLFLNKPFDVYIVGHSCGLSDRVLFSTIFNNDNCEHIYPFYYEREPGKDDFTEKTYELSRHFVSAEKFREKVRHKSKCLKLNP